MLARTLHADHHISWRMTLTACRQMLLDITGKCHVSLLPSLKPHITQSFLYGEGTLIDSGLCGLVDYVYQM